MGQCQIVPVLTSFFYIPTSSTQVPAPLSPVIFFRLCVLKAQSLDPNPLLHGLMELSVSSFQLILTSLDLFISLSLSSCYYYLACSVACLPILPKLCPVAIQSQKRQNCIPPSNFPSVFLFASLYQRRTPTFSSLYFYHLFSRAQLKIR